jgi:hypothetical protein
MMFYAIFWAAYLPFVLLTLSIVVERLMHHSESHAAPPAKPARLQ